MNPAVWDVERAKRDEQIARAGLLREAYRHRRHQQSGAWSPVSVLRLKLGAGLVRVGYALAGPSAARLSRVSPDVGAEMRPLSR